MLNSDKHSILASCLLCTSSPRASEVTVGVFPDSVQAPYCNSFYCKCLKLCHCPPTPNWAVDRADQVCVPSIRPVISQLSIADNRPNHPLPTSNHPLQAESNFGDSSGPLFSIYSKAAEDEDNKMVERWQKDADGILIFVSPRVSMHLSLHITGML